MDRKEESNRIPIVLAIRDTSGELVADLVVGKHATVESLKMQLEGLEGTPMDNQTLLLAGRTLENDATLASVGVFDSATLTLVHCSPQLAGAITLRDLKRLVADDIALDRAIDAYEEVMQYTGAQVTAIVGAVVSALIPKDKILVQQILDALPLHLLADHVDDLPEAKELDVVCTKSRGDPKTENLAPWALAYYYGSEDLTSNCDTEATQTEHSTSYFDMDPDSAVDGQHTRRERRERFTQCVQAALEMVLHAIRERDGQLVDAL